MTRTGGSLLVQALVAADVDEVFTLHGGHLDAFYAASAEWSVRLTDARHEASAGHAADAYARLTGRPGVCVVTSGPGFTNVLTAVTNAYLDAVPVLFVVGGPPLRETETNPLQGGFDQIAMAAPVTKWAHRVTEAHRIPELVAQALRVAVSARPGPVLLEVPIDVMFRPVDDSVVRWPAPVAVAPAAPDAAAVAQAIELLARAERPAIIAGGGVQLSRSHRQLVALAERVGAPVYTPNKADGSMPADHPLWGGGFTHLSLLGAIGGPTPDVVLLAGARTGLFTGGRAGVLAGAELIQIDVDAAEIDRLHDTRVPILADCGASLAALEQAAAERDWPRRDAWLEAVRAVIAAPAAMFPDQQTPSGRPHPHHAAQAIADAAPPRAVYVLDGGEAGFWMDSVLRPLEPNSVVRIGYLGTLGVGPGFAIGAARADSTRPILHVTGDGAAGFHLGDFDTMARHGLPIVTVILNNASWGMSLHGQEAVYGEAGVVASRLADSDYDQAAAAFGLHAERVRTVDEVGPAIRRAFASGRPACINLEIAPEVVHPFTTQMVGSTDTLNEIVVPYYENIPVTIGAPA